MNNDTSYMISLYQQANTIKVDIKIKKIMLDGTKHV